MNSLYDFNDLVYSVGKWADDRNILEGSDIKTQTLKCVSEVGELADNVAQGKCVIDDIGDMLVTLIIIAEFQGLSLNECLYHAYNEIKDRKGKMINNVFVKEGDE